MKLSKKVNPFACTGILLLAFGAFSLIAEDTASKTTPKKLNTQNKIPDKRDFDMYSYKEFVLNKCRKLKSNSKTPGLEAMSGLAMRSEAEAFAEIAKHPYVEDATRIRRTWFKKIALSLLAMSKQKAEMEVAEERDLKQRYDVANEKFRVMEKSFKKIMAKPEKVSKRRRRR